MCECFITLSHQSQKESEDSQEQLKNFEKLLAQERKKCAEKKEELEDKIDLGGGFYFASSKTI